jgi:xanthine/uracil permease
MADEFQLVYTTDEKPRTTRDGLLYTLQWIFTMFYPAVWGYTIVGVGLGLQGSQMAGYMGRVVLMIGIATIVQAVAGHRFAMVSGPNIIPSLAIVAAFAVGGKEYALLSFNAYIIAGVLIAILGGLGLISLVGKIWTPLVLGAMMMMVGLTTSSVGMSMLAAQAATWPFFVGIVLALMCGWLSLRGKGVLATLPVLITIVSGYVIFMLFGKFDWQLVRSMPTFSLRWVSRCCRLPSLTRCPGWWARCSRIR